MSEGKMRSPKSPKTPKSPGSLSAPASAASPVSTHTSALGVPTLTGFSHTVYTIDAQIGKGGFGVVFACYDPKRQFYALKTERSSAVLLEVEVLRRAERQGCKHFAKYIDDGWADTVKQSFVVMELLGPSLSEVKNLLELGKFSSGTGLIVAIELLEAIEELHSLCFISRDVKPSNFVTCPRIYNSKTIYMIDFGIAKKIKQNPRDHFLLAPDPTPHFRGTARYCSLNNHEKIDCGRKDDLESWLYTCADLMNGRLPWQKLSRKRNEIKLFKKAIRGSKRQEFLGDLPSVFGEFMDKIDGWDFWSEPEYGWMREKLLEELERTGTDHAAPYDWEKLPLFSSTGTTSLRTGGNNTLTVMHSENLTQEETESRNDG